jgi:hypothetical protein
MSMTLPLDQMTTAEKLQAMEQLWADLTQNDRQFESPAWHEAVLTERETRLESGQEAPLDWTEVKNELRDLSK